METPDIYWVGLSCVVLVVISRMSRTCNGRDLQLPAAWNPYSDSNWPVTTSLRFAGPRGDHVRDTVVAHYLRFNALSASVTGNGPRWKGAVLTRVGPDHRAVVSSNQKDSVLGSVHSWIPTPLPSSPSSLVPCSAIHSTLDISCGAAGEKSNKYP